MNPLEQIQDQAQGSLTATPRELFSQEAFEPKERGAQSVQQALPVDERPDRGEFAMFLHDLRTKYDSHKESWQYPILKWLDGEDTMGSSINRKALSRAEKDPTWTKQERQYLDIVKRNFDTFQYLNPREGDFFDGNIIDANRIQAIRELDPNSERGENIRASYDNTRLKTLGIRGSTDAGKDSLWESCKTEYDTEIQPKIQRLLNELRAEPTAELLKLAKSGNADAQEQVARCYVDGAERYVAGGSLSPFDVRQLEKALPWLNASARQGDKESLYMLADKIGENGVEPAKNAFEKVVEFYEKEAQSGDPISREILGCLKDGRRNEVAAELYKKSADQGDESAIYVLGQFTKGFNKFGHELKTPLSDEAQLRYVSALEGYAKKGNVSANVIMGEIYELGAGVPADGKKAEQFYRKAAEAGNTEAQLHMGIIYYEGDVVEKNLEESAKWFKKAGEVVDWQLSEILHYQMGRGAPEQVFAGLPKDVEKLSDTERSSMLDKLNDERNRPYDMNIVKFANKAAGIK